jgi:hypothetical protein
MRVKAKTRKGLTGKLRIGDDWNAITIIALSQNNPLKAIAEFVENSIDAQAKTVTIIRGKEHGRQYLKIIDDGQGIPCAEDGAPDFKYVATHICDSLKRRLKEQGIQGIQGEFGIGLLSFWTVGHKLTLISSGKDSRTYQMEMEKGKSGYKITQRYHLTAIKGTQLIVSPLLEGLRLLTGEKIQRYLASELRDRIRNSGVKVKVIDRTGRAEYEVEPRRYEGRLIHDLPAITTVFGDIYAEIYLIEKNPENTIGLFRSGTRVRPNISELDAFNCQPWNSGYFQGIIDAPFLHLTPGTRDGVIHDERFANFCDALSILKERLNIIVEEQSKAEEERASQNILRSVQKAFREAMLALPREEYDWFEVYEKNKRAAVVGQKPTAGDSGDTAAAAVHEDERNDEAFPPNSAQQKLFETAGPLFYCRIRPASTIVSAGKIKAFRAVAQDRFRRQVEDRLTFSWNIIEGGGSLDCLDSEIVQFQAPSEPGLSRIKLKIIQGQVSCEAEAVITIVDSLIPPSQLESQSTAKGLPGYTLESAHGQLWRSRYDSQRNIVVINSGHRDFVYASRERTRKLRYICRLFAKELVFSNFPGASSEQLLERLVELSLYTEDNLR